MIFDKMFTQNNVLETAMQASEFKNQVILNNMANADTPNFKGSEVEFESILNDAIESSKMTGKLDMSSVLPAVKRQHSGYKVRIDENNVDIETEMTKFYKNSAKYDVIVNGVLNNNSRLNTVLSGLK